MSEKREQVFQRVYVDLDSLIDTRIGVASILNPQAGVDLIHNDEYYKRRHDNLGDFTDKITTEEFKEAWKNRSVEALMVSKPTEMIVGLPLMFGKLEQDMISTPFVSGIGLEINVWPYKLNAAEKTNILGAMRYHIGHAPDITIIDVDPLQLTPAYIKEKYSAVLMYEFATWLETIYPKLQTQTKLVDITFIAPALYSPNSNKIPTSEDLVLEYDDGTPNKKVDPFAVSEYLLSVYIHICYQNAYDFSIVSPKRLKKYVERERQLKEKLKAQAEQMRKEEEG